MLAGGEDADDGADEEGDENADDAAADEAGEAAGSGSLPHPLSTSATSTMTAPARRTRGSLPRTSSPGPTLRPCSPEAPPICSS